MPQQNIKIQNKHIRECNWNNKKHIFTKIFSWTEQNRTEVYLKIPKGINATRIYKHNITQCTNMAVDGVVINCSRICNKHKYFVSVVEKVNFFFFFFFFFYSSQKTCCGCSNSPVSKRRFFWPLTQRMIREAFITSYLEGLVLVFQSYVTATSPSFCLTKDGGVCTINFK